MAASLRELFVAEVERYRGTVERKLNDQGINRGIEVDYWLKLCGFPVPNDWASPGGAWCMASLHGCGIQAVGRSQWELPLSARVQDVVDWAKTHDRFHQDVSRVEVGDLMVFFYAGLTPPHYGHVGAVKKVVGGGKFLNDEGNSNTDGSRDGYKLVEQARTWSPRCGIVRPWP